MARCPQWSPQARQDLRDIAARRRARGVPKHRIAATITAIREAAREACTFPMRRQTPETNDPNTREVFAENYRVIYLLRNPGISVVRVVHMSQDLTADDIVP